MKNNAEMTINVYNVAGQRVMEQNGNAIAGLNVYNLNTAALANGMYFVRVNAGVQSGVVKMTIAK
jgi:hypothetical protein